MMTKQDFPMMIYHLIEKAKIIDTQEQLRKYMSSGWSSKPIKDGIDSLLAQKAWHESKINEIDSKLAELQPGGSPTDTKIEPEPVTDEQKPKRRGRPRQNG